MAVRLVWLVMGDAGYGDGCYVRAAFSTYQAAQAFLTSHPEYVEVIELVLDRPELW